MAQRPQKPTDVALEKGLPVNLDAERLVLGSILLDGGRYVQAAGTLTPDDFSLQKHRLIFQRMADLQERSHAIDRVTVAEELMRNAELEACDGLAYLISLDDGLPNIVNLDEYVRIVKQKSALRKTIFATQNLMNRCLVQERPEDLHAAAEEILLALGSDDLDGGPQTLGEVVRSLPGGLQEFLGPRQMGLETGFRRFDEMTSGFHPGQLIILAARPGQGKTSLALNIAEFAAVKRKKTVMFFSLEMSKFELLHRLTCARARVDSQKVRLGYTNAEERRKLMLSANELAEANLLIDDKSAASYPQVHALIRKQMVKGPVDLAVIDYLQLMSAGRTFENKNQEVTAISRGLKLMAAELGVPLLVLSQLNRAPELRKGNNRPQLSDLRESGAIEQDADLVAFIFREELYKKDREDLRGLAELIIAKQRSGPVDTINLVFIHQLTKFENRAEDMDEPAPLLKTGRGKDDAAGTYTPEWE